MKRGITIKMILLQVRVEVLKLTSKEASTVLCSVVKHAGSGKARKKCRGKHIT